VHSQTSAKASNNVDINQSLLTTTSTDTFFRFLPLEIVGGATGVDTSCGSMPSDDGRCVCLETVLPMEEIPLDLRLYTPFVLPLASETCGFAKIIEIFSTITTINTEKMGTCYRSRPEQLGE
jgi:hypothetical protein